MTTVGLAGLGYWGPNLARNFDNLARLAWLCDLDEGLRRTVGGRHPRARATSNRRRAWPELVSAIASIRPSAISSIAVMMLVSAACAS